MFDRYDIIYLVLHNYDTVQPRWSHVEEHWDGEAILRRRGAPFVKSHCVRSSCHELSVAMTLLSGMAPLTNGATISIFPGQHSPLNITTVLVGYPQTRKYQMSKLLKSIGDVLDETIHASAKARVLQADVGDHRTNGGGLVAHAGDPSQARADNPNVLDVWHACIVHPSCLVRTLQW
jgi:hypothetical protein